MGSTSSRPGARRADRAGMRVGVRSETIKTVILCGGQGTRLADETERKPKPMVVVGGKPLLWHIMKIYAAQGFSDFVLCLGYKGEVIKEYFLNYTLINSDFTIQLGGGAPIALHASHAPDDWRVTLVDTGPLTMTGARVRKVERHIESELFFVTYGDGVASINLQDLLRFHRSHGKIATVTGVRPPARFGELGTSGMQVRRFSEKPESSRSYINGGFFVFDRRVFAYLPDRDDCALERQPLQRLARDGELMMFHHDGFWHCVDTPRDLQDLQRTWDAGRPPWKIWDDAVAPAGGAVASGRGRSAFSRPGFDDER